MFSNRVVFMHQGTIDCDGAPEALFGSRRIRAL